MNAWLQGARPRTLPAAIVPVVVGTAVAATATAGGVVWWRAGAALVTALALQVGTNYANDYSDGVRGTDDTRAGPLRLVASGLKPAATVRTAAVLSFAVAALAGLTLAAAVSWWLLAVGAASIAAGWFYTGGPKPYGYAGYGEVFVFVFFGVVATVGSAYVHLEEVTALAVLASIPVGVLVTALLVANNLRDIPTDAIAGKKTLAVRAGDGATRALYVVLVAVAAPLGTLAVAPLAPVALVALVAFALAVAPARRVAAGDTGVDLIAVLVATSRLHLVYGVLLGLGIALS
jgi:1,4-dihydroxy-2-naphthoate octaprenyltransferase